jgi:hypothetical protein
MSSRLIVPFDFNPIETKNISTNYTIPAGKYARVMAVDVAVFIVDYGANPTDGVTTAVNPFILADGASINRASSVSIVLNTSANNANRFQNVTFPTPFGATVNLYSSQYSVGALSGTGGASLASVEHRVRGVTQTITRTSTGNYNSTTYERLTGISRLRHQINATSTAALQYLARAVFSHEELVADSFWITSGGIIDLNSSTSIVRLEEYNVVS